MSIMMSGHWPKYKLPVACILILVVIFITVMLTGCTISSVSNPNLYLMEFGYNASAVNQGIYQYGFVPAPNAYYNISQFKVRAGYFSLCINPGSAESRWLCSSDCKWLRNQETADILNLLSLACHMRSDDFSPWPLIISLVTTLITAVLVLIFSAVTYLTTIVLTMAAVFCLLGMTWQQSSVNSIKSVVHSVSQEFVISISSSSLAGLGWTSLVLQVMVGLCLVYEMISYSISDRMSVDEEKFMDNHNTLHTSIHRDPSHHESIRGRSRSRHSFIAPSLRHARSRSASVDY